MVTLLRPPPVRSGLGRRRRPSATRVSEGRGVGHDDAPLGQPVQVDPIKAGAEAPYVLERGVVSSSPGGKYVPRGGHGVVTA